MTTTSDALDIRVRRCTVRVRRHGGWSWGEPAAYVDPVVAAIEDALRRATALANVPQDSKLTLVDAVALEITADGSVTPASLDTLVERLRTAAADASHARAAADATAAPSHPAPAVAAEEEEVATGVGAVPDLPGLAEILGRWSRSGRLAVLTGSWPIAALDAWVAALRVGADGPGAQPAGPPAAAVEAIASAVLGDSAPPLGERGRPARFLVLAGAVASALGNRLPDQATMTVIARLAGLPPDRPPAPPDLQRSGAGPREPRSPRPAGNALHPPGTVGPVVVPALPFLVLVQLHRLGFLEPATATLAAAGVAPAAESLAAAVAGKVLDPPRHGWLRSPAERLAVELASGLTSEQVDAVAAQWRENAGALLVPLRTMLAELYAEGRGRYDEVVVTRAGGDVVCGEAAGLLPIAWAGREDDMTAVLAQLGEPPVRESDIMVPLIDVLRPRRALPGLDAPELERWLGSVAGTALGSLAQELWDEDADAVLALERLGGLEARVGVGDRRTIGVPRGQRWLDLRRVGLLDAWPMPWAPGGVWELATW